MIKECFVLMKDTIRMVDGYIFVDYSGTVMQYLEITQTVLC